MNRLQTNKDTILVSVIVPVWNPGEGIIRCIDSLRGQTLSRIEMIFVDDCGSDDAIQRIRKAASDDHRIRIIRNSENLGPGPSRNRGIEVAKGEYLSFVDADDYVEPDFLERLYRKAKRGSCDIVKGITLTSRKGDRCSFQMLIKTDKDRSFWIEKNYNAGEPLFYLFTYKFYSAIYHRDLFLDPVVRFGTTRISEDVTFLLHVCRVAKSFSVEAGACYHYVLRRGSTISNISYQTGKEKMKAFREQVRLLEEGPDNEFCRLALRERINSALSWQVQMAHKIQSKKFAADFLGELREVVSNLRQAQKLAEEYTEIGALVRYGVNLCQQPYPSVDTADKAADQRAIASKWTDAEENKSNGIPKVSAIIPFFRAGRKIYRCIQSLQGQSLSDIEIIFVDDGSDDDSKEYVFAAQERDSRIRVITNHDNLGPGRSRNLAIKEANGEYLSFIDADDEISEDFFETLYMCAKENDADIAKGSVMLVRSPETSPVQIPYLEEDLQIADGLQQHIPLYYLFHAHYQSAIYRRSMVEKHEVQFSNTRASEDRLFLLKSCCVTDSFIQCPEARYYYHQWNNSASRTYQRRRLDEEEQTLHDQLAYLFENCREDAFSIPHAEWVVTTELRLHTRIAHFPEMKKEAKNFLENIQKEVTNYPLLVNNENCACYIEGLVRSGMNLCTQPYWANLDLYEEEDREEIVRSWTEYLLLEAETEERFLKEARKVFKEAYAFWMQLETSSDKEKADRFIRELTRCRKKLEQAGKWPSGGAK